MKASMNHPVLNTRRQFSCDDLFKLLGREATIDETNADRRFSCLVPDSFVQCIASHTPDDPLLRQVLPSGRELQDVAGFSKDPLLENDARPVPGLIRRFEGRALLLTTGSCAIHCRYCFRRHAPFRDIPTTPQDWQPVLSHLMTDSSVHEVILSGGDPLTLPDSFLGWLASELAKIPHIRRLRIHTRMAVVSPERVHDGLIHWLTATRLQPIVMTHINHPAELSEAAVAAMLHLKNAGVLLFNQSVLLAGVNDSAETLAQLSESLIAAHITPCYLHLLDPVAGAAHFQVDDETGRLLVQQLRRMIPGYAVPRLVRELPELGIKQIVAG